MDPRMIESLLQAGPGGLDVAAAVRRATERAQRDGAVDIAYAELDSPLGTLVAATTDAGLVRLAYEEWSGGLDAVLDHLATRVSPRIVEARPKLDALDRQLHEYFEGHRTTFDVPVDLQLTSGFTTRILEAIRRIPFGQTSNYKGVATEAGNPKAVRAAGNACGANPVPIVVPCHRVLKTGGGLGGYTGGVEKKETLLRLEGYFG
jgi:methylated-DNA-[protein]-cysteine S-methyltransferase